MSNEVTLLRIYYYIMQDVKKDLPRATALDRLIFAVKMVQAQKAVLIP